MELTSLLGSFLGADTLNSIGSATDTKASDVATVLTAALPSLLAGASAQANNEKTAESFANALNHHSADTTNMGSLVETVDVKDGEKVVQHLLGDETEDATAAISQASGVDRIKTSTILAIAAPLLLSALSNNSTNNTTSSTTSLLGSLLGGNSTANAQASTLGALGSLLGATQPQQQSTGLLGSLLGGGQTQQVQQTQQSGGLLSSLFGGGQTQQVQQTSVANNGVDMSSALSLLSSLASSGVLNNAAAADTSNQLQQVTPAAAKEEESKPSNSLLGGLLGLLK